MTIDITKILQYSRRHESIGEHLFQNWLYDKIVELVGDTGLTVDACGNMWVELADPKDAPFLFVAHIDTVHSQDGLVRLMHYTVSGSSMIGLANKEMGCLGADDGCGVYANLKMMEAGVKGTYLFTRGEEGGAVGAEFIIASDPDKLSQFQLCLEVDRQGTTEIVVENCTGKGASKEFGEALGLQLGMGHVTSDMGIYTDIALFNGLIPECVNLAAGYDRQHTSKERLNITYLEKLIARLIKVDWDSLPIKRETDDYGEVLAMYGSNSLDNSQSYYLSAYDREFEGYGTTTKSQFSLDFEAMEEYAWTNADRVADYLTSYGITVAEVEEHWRSKDIPF